MNLNPAPQLKFVLSDISSSSQDLAQTRSEPSIVQRAAVDDVRSSPQSVKANLISRMAKMGQPLPFKTAAPMPSDSDDTEVMSTKLRLNMEMCKISGSRDLRISSNFLEVGSGEIALKIVK